jgi:hypothetical protein
MFLNSNENEQLKAKGIRDKTTMVMEPKKIFKRRNLFQQDQNKCISMKRNIESFNNKYENLVKTGLSSSWNDKGKLLSFEENRKKLFTTRESEEKFQGINDNLRGREIVDLLIDDFYLLWKVKNILSNPPTYEKYTELGIVYKQMK